MPSSSAPARRKQRSRPDLPGFPVGKRGRNASKSLSPNWLQRSLPCRGPPRRAQGGIPRCFNPRADPAGPGCGGSPGWGARSVGLSTCAWRSGRAGATTCGCASPVTSTPAQRLGFVERRMTEEQLPSWRQDWRKERDLRLRFLDDHTKPRQFLLGLLC